MKPCDLAFPAERRAGRDRRPPTGPGLVLVGTGTADESGDAR